MGQGGIVRGVETSAVGRQTGLNFKLRQQEEGLYSQGAGGPWVEDHSGEMGVGVGGGRF